MKTAWTCEILQMDVIEFHQHGTKDRESVIISEHARTP